MARRMGSPTLSFRSIYGGIRALEEVHFPVFQRTWMET